MKISYIPALLLLSVLSLLAHYFIFQAIGFEWNAFIWALYIYFPLLSLIIHRVLAKQVEGRPQTFVTLFMGTMAGKLFFSLIILLMVLYLNPEIKIPFAISFLFLYLVYTTLNTAFIFSKLRAK